MLRPIARGFCTTLLLIVGCSQGSADKCFVGDAAKPVELVIVHQTPQRQLMETQPGGRIPLIQPVQGGKVLFVGVRARNLDGCPLHVGSSLIDTAAGTTISHEERDVIMRPANGWLEPDLPSEPDNYSNLTLCPMPNLPKAIDEESYTLKVDVQDHAKRSQSASLMVVPFCSEPAIADRCKCECQKNYMLGAMCGVFDAGDGDSGAGDGH